MASPIMQAACTTLAAPRSPPVINKPVNLCIVITDIMSGCQPVTGQNTGHTPACSSHSGTTAAPFRWRPVKAQTNQETMTSYMANSGPASARTCPSKAPYTPSPLVPTPMSQSSPASSLASDTSLGPFPSSSSDASAAYNQPTSSLLYSFPAIILELPRQPRRPPPHP